MKKHRNIAVLIESSRAYGRELIRGVSQYSHEHAYWTVSFTPSGLEEMPPSWFKYWKGDGILARISNRRMADAVLQHAGVPAVELRGALGNLPIPFIGIDNKVVAGLALDHLMSRGLRHFAFCGLLQGKYLRMDERRNHFVQLAHEK